MIKSKVFYNPYLKEINVSMSEERYMMQGLRKLITLTAVSVIMIFSLLTVNATTVLGAENIEVPGTIYRLDGDDAYKLETAPITTSAKSMGTLTLSGNISDAGGMDGASAFYVGNGNVDVKYNFNAAILEAKEGEWQLETDKSDKVNGSKLSGKIKSGALVLQSSLDGENWADDTSMTDVFKSKDSLSNPFYKTKDIQQQNGCYYRLLVVYKLKKKTGEKKVGPIKMDEYEYNRFIEEYKFFLQNESGSNTMSAADTPRKVLGESVNTGKDNGFSESNALDSNDPHFNMNLGEFSINGYTRETEDDDGNPVFLKNVGDRVTLWFRLEQDIKALKGDPTLTIAEDKKAYDKYFQVPATNFGHGALIIRYTDYQGVKHDPVIYTNYLQANAKTSADTRAQLFEEGDYEVSLDYEIKNSPRKVGDIEVVPTFTDYKIFFKFSIRNGNNMVYPMDLVTGQELSDGDITENGFKLDMARSRYLTIDVKRSVINESLDGILTEDVRFNRPARDGEEYADEGIYTFTVKNLYTDSEPTTKTIYVGSDKILRALSKSGLTIKEINSKLSSGSEIQDDGTIVRKSNYSRR